MSPRVSVDVARAHEEDGPTQNPTEALIVRSLGAVRNRKPEPRLPDQEQAILDAVLATFERAREIAGPLPPGGVLDRVEGAGVVVELVAVDLVRDLDDEEHVA